MSRITSVIGALCALMLAWLAPAPAGAADLHVSFLGNDNTGNGSFGNPFRTYQRAVDAAQDGDRIIGREFGGFGPVVIRKKTLTLTSVPGGGIISPGTDAITFNGDPNDELFVINLTIDLGGTSNNGIRFNRGRKLNVVNTRIQGAGGGSSGIFFRSNTNTELNVVAGNFIGTGVSGKGSAIRIQPRSGADVKAVIRDSFLSNSRTGVNVIGDDGGVSNIIVSDTTITGGRTGVSSSGPNATVLIENSRITHNDNAGLQSINGGVLLTAGSPPTNTIFNNNPNGSFTGTFPKQ